MPRPNLCLLALALALGLGLLRAAEPEPRWRTLNRAAREAVQAKDYAKLRTALQELKPLLPGNPTPQWALAG